MKLSQPSILIGHFGVCQTFGHNYTDTVRLYYIVGYCPAESSLSDTPLIKKGNFSFGAVQNKSKSNRFVVLTPKVDKTGKCKGSVIYMTPIESVINKHFRPLTKQEWLDKVNEILVGACAIGNESFWTPDSVK